MLPRSGSHWWGVVLEAPDGPALARFYGGLLGWRRHLDLEVGDLDEAVAVAVRAGATVAGHQPQEHVRVLLDPAGHPFCVYVDR